MRRSFLFLLALFLLSPLAFAQNIPVALEYTRIYDYLDELSTDGIILKNEAVRPYSRIQIAQMLLQAEQRDSLLSRRQKKELQYYLNEFSLERDTMPEKYVQYTNHRNYNLSLCDPQFSYMTSNHQFKMQLRPILGMDLYGSKKGAIIKRWWGADLQMDIANHVSIWGSLRDISYNGTMALNKDYFPTQTAQIDGAKLTKPAFLNMQPGVEYKEANYGGDFSDSRGGLSLYTWWGSIGLSRENIRWGDAYHSSNILSGHNPAVPQLNLQLTPCSWFQFDYFHAWLVSNVLDSTKYYLENTTAGKYDYEYRPANKFMAANMFSFMPIKYITFAFGNSIVYAENNVQAAYFIPIAFYKSLDHLLTKGIRSENQNSQAFATLTIRPVDHLKLYGSFYVDELKFSRFTKADKENNPISYLVGFDWGGWPLRGLSLKAEFMRSYIACYTHSIDVLTFASNGYNLGHYMGDNAQSIFAELSYRPYRSMWLSLSYTHDTKYNSYAYLRNYRDQNGVIRDGGIGQTISQKPFDKVIYRNEEWALNYVFEVHPHMYLRANLIYNHARGFDNPKTSSTILSEYTSTAQGYLNRFCPLYLQGQNLTAMVGFSFGF